MVIDINEMYRMIMTMMMMMMMKMKLIITDIENVRNE